MNTMQLLTGPLAQAIGWALLHLLWQATLVAAILAAVLKLMSRQSAGARYVVSCGALAIVFSMFVATAIRAYDPAAEPIATESAAAQPTKVKLSFSDISALVAQTAAVSLRERLLAAATSARQALPSIVGIWLAGVFLLSARLLVSWIRARRLARRGSQVASAHWHLVAARLANALGLRRAVTLLESSAVEVPSVIGSLRPIILIPASALTGMTPEQIEMVLAHELAHIRRHDFLINLLQAVVETLMFYHPAVWWMSRQVRIERENCCDDLAVAVCGNPLQYARALTRLEELRAALPVLVAANGGSLLDRIRRIAAGRAEGTSLSSRWAAAVAVLSLVLLGVAIPSLPALAQREEKQKTESAKTAQTKVDVVAKDDSKSDFNYEYDGEPAADVDPDVDIDPPDVDVDVDIPVDVDVDIDDPDLDDLYTPMPAVPVPPAPAIAPVPHGTPAPAVMPVPALAPVVAPRPPRTPRPPVAAIAWADMDRDDDDDHEADDRELGANGKLSVDELISLRAAGVTPEYVNKMRAIFPGLTLRGVTSMGALGVTPDFVSRMRAAGLDVKTAREATSLAAVGVTPEFIKEMRDAGFAVSSSHEATSLAAVGVTPEYVRRMRDAGFALKSAHDATSLAAVGVTPEYVREMRNAGFEIATARDASSMKAVGVSPQWVKDMKAAGVNVTTAKEATSLAAVGVTPAFVKKLANAGYANLSVRELTRLAAAGVDDDFIREMQQYRK